MLVTRNVGDRVASDQRLAQCGQGLVLCWLKPSALQAFEFNADGVVVAVVSPAVMGTTGMPRAVVTADELPEFTVPTDVEVRGHLQPSDLLVVRVGIPVQAIGEQFLDRKSVV